MKICENPRKSMKVKKESMEIKNESPKIYQHVRAILKIYENPSEFDPRKYLLLSKDAMKEVVKSRLQEFGTAGNASSINTISLGEMAKKYKSGKFKAVTT